MDTNLQVRELRERAPGLCSECLLEPAGGTGRAGERGAYKAGPRAIGAHSGEGTTELKPG